MHDRARDVGLIDTLGVAVRTRRRELGLRQDELAALASVSTRFVHSLEHNKQSVRLDALLRVLQTLGLSLLVTGPNTCTEVRIPETDSDYATDNTAHHESGARE